MLSLQFINGWCWIFQSVQTGQQSSELRKETMWLWQKNLWAASLRSPNLGQHVVI